MKSFILQVCWSPEEDFGTSSEDLIRCASADASGQIIVWNVLDGNIVSSFRHQNSALKSESLRLCRFFVF